MIDFSTPPHIVFGARASSRVGEIARSVGVRALVVTGRSADRARPIVDGLERAGVSSVFFAVAGEPSIATALAGVQAARDASVTLVVAVGGGSALDAGKAIAALATNAGDVFDYLETVGRGHPMVTAALPVIAVPTTAGTGSEATRNAVLASPEHRVKVSLRHVSMIPRVAVVDPELALGLPAAVTRSTGLDALTQLVEPFVSCRRNPMVDALAVAGIERVARSLTRAVAAPDDIEARSDMALAALWSGMALSNAALGAVHGLAGPIGGMFGAPHGAVCAALLPHVMSANVTALERAGDRDTLARYGRVAELLTGRAAATAADGVVWVRALVSDLGVPGLGTYGITAARVDDIIEPARRASSMKGNPVELSAVELGAILEAAI